MMPSFFWRLQRLLSLLLIAICPQVQSTLPIAFVHIPKTAGTSLSIAFEKRWAAEGCHHVNINNDTEISVLLDLAHKIYPEEWSSKHLVTLRRPGFKCLWTRLHAGPDRNDRITFARKVMEGRMPPVTYLAGHLPHGFCTFMPSGCRYVTVLREPTQRILSHYYYLQQRHPDYLRSICRNCTDIDAFARELSAGNVKDLVMENMQTRMIAGDGFWSSISNSSNCRLRLHACDVQPSSRTMLQVAKLNLRQYFDVGIVEDIDAFAHRMGLQLPHLNKGESYAADLMPETIKLLRQSQELDMQLYELAKKLSAEHAARVSSLHISTSAISLHKAASEG